MTGESEEESPEGGHSLSRELRDDHRYLRNAGWFYTADLMIRSAAQIERLEAELTRKRLGTSAFSRALNRLFGSPTVPAEPSELRQARRPQQQQGIASDAGKASQPEPGRGDVIWKLARQKRDENDNNSAIR